MGRELSPESQLVCVCLVSREPLPFELSLDSLERVSLETPLVVEVMVESKASPGAEVSGLFSVKAMGDTA